MKYLNICIIVAVVAILLATIKYPNFLNILCPIQWISYFKGKERIHSFIDSGTSSLFEDISSFKCLTPGTPCYLAIVGRVYDVTAGDKHYGAKGGYHFFTGKDASLAYVTGNFTSEGLISDINLLERDYQMLEVLKWMQFYQDKYIYKGKLIGLFYDETGGATDNLKVAERRLQVALEAEKATNHQNIVTPPCDSSWTKDTGNIYSCTTSSGGIVRSWIGYPRRHYYEHSIENSDAVTIATLSPVEHRWRCVCVQSHKDDLPRNFKEFDECTKQAHTCKDMET